MWSGFLNSSNVVGLEQTLAFTERRHQLLAGNVANMDTPGYKARDLSTEDFQATLSDAFEALKDSDEAGLSSGEPLSKSLRDQLATKANQSLEKVRDSMKEVLFHDGSNDSLEQQVTEIAKNQSMHSTATTLLRAQFRTLQAAISESVNV